MAIGTVARVTGGGWRRVLVVAGLLLAALALAGAPLTSGAAAKAYLKTAKEPLAAPWPEVIETFLQLGAVGTTVLMGRFLLAAWTRSDRRSDGGRFSAGLWLPWAVLLAAVATLVVLLPDDVADTLDLVLSFSALWPAVVGLPSSAPACSPCAGAAGASVRRSPRATCWCRRSACWAPRDASG